MEPVNSCLMLSASLHTGIDLSAVFEDSDLLDTGIERDSHLTIFFSADKIVPRDGLADKIKTLLGEDNPIYSDMKENKRYKILEFFELGKFENDRDYLVLKLTEGNHIFDALKILNTGLMSYYNLTSTFKDYTPHMTLAILEPGTAKKYMFSGTLGLILESAEFELDDFVLSYGDGEGEFKQYNITSYNAVSRYFRQKELSEYKDNPI